MTELDKALEEILAKFPGCLVVRARFWQGAFYLDLETPLETRWEFRVTAVLKTEMTGTKVHASTELGIRSRTLP